VAANARSDRAGASKRGQLLVVLVVVGVVGVAVVGYALTSTGGGGGRMAVAPVELVGAYDPQLLLQLAKGAVLGDSAAPITIMEFADYSCPACGAFQAQIKPRIELAYVQDGVAKLVFHDRVLGSFPHSFLAARAARCAGDQGRYFDYHDALFQNQADWSTRSATPVGLLEDYAEGIGLDGDAFSGCLRSNRHADVVTANIRLAEQLNVYSTPTVLVRAGGLPNRPDSDFQSIADAVEALRPKG
jgi:protein-disulfide isomerase